MAVDKRIPGNRPKDPRLNVAGKNADGVVAPGLVARLRTLVPSMHPADRRIAEYVLDDPARAVMLSASDVADASAASTATVVRFAQKLGLRGFQHFKIALAHDISARSPIRASTLTAKSSAEAVLNAVLESAIESLTNIRDTVEAQHFEQAVHALGRARKILVTGVGSSSGIAQDAAYRFMAIGLPAEAPPDAHVQHISARLLTGSDVLMAISNSGGTRDTVENVQAATAAGATTIALTAFRRSPLTDAATISLVAGAPKVLAIRTESVASRIGLLALVDGLLVAIALRHRSRANAALDAIEEVAARHRY